MTTHVKRKSKAVARRRGFALIATLVLLVLLGLIAVGILAVASSQNRIAAHLLVQAEARQQALMGLDAAISELQVQLGPDQRVTASSGILSGGSEGAEGSPHILGVWNSWTAPLYGQMGSQRINNTYSEGRSSMFRRWLISCNDPQKASRLRSVSELGSRRSGERVCLVGAGSLGNGAGQHHHVYADLVQTPSSGRNVGSIAWWIGGENQKVNVAIKQRPQTEDPMEMLHRTWDTPAPVFSASGNMSGLSDIEENKIDKLLTLSTVPLAKRASAESGTPYFFDATTYSYTLPVNVRDGGLKHDLNLLLNKKNLSGTEFKRRSDQDCPLAEGHGLPEGTESRMPIGSWQVMHAYYNSWPIGGSEDGSFAARVQGTPMHAYTRISGGLISETMAKGDKVTYYDTRTEDNDMQAGYARTPVFTAFLGCWGLQVSRTQYNKGNTLHYVYSPMVMWWNPYNVEMRVGAKKLWTFPLPYRTTSVQAWDDRVEKCPTPDRSPWSPRLIMHTCESKGTGIPWQHAFRLDWGNYFVNSESDQKSDIVFAPGEILVFTLAGDVLSLNEMHSYGIPHEFPFIVGDHPERMTHFRSDFQEYVNLTNPAANSMYDMHIDRFHARLKLESKKTPYFNAEIAYGLMTNGKQGDYFVSMGEVRSAAAEYTDEDHTHVPGREAFTITYGYDGLDNDASGDANIRRSAQVDRFCGAKGISPASFMLGWYDYDAISGDEMTFMNEVWSADMFGQDPVYYVAVGVVPKSYNQSFNDGFPMFRGKDYRCKSWQHSSPAFWGSALSKPDEQQRQYHPFQLAALPMGLGMDRGVFDTVNGRNGIFGISSVGSGGGEGVSFISVLELPLHPPFSLAGFSGMRLTPGWYETSGSGDARSFARARRMQYQAGVPGVGIGNSFADPALPADDVYVFHESSINSSFPSNGRLFSDFYDHGFIINDALWDRWFCSSVSDMPDKSGSVIKAEQVLTQFVNGEDSLPVSRYKLNTSTHGSKNAVARIMEEDGWKKIARYLLIEGGFNVNSVSVEAWEANLLALSRRDLVTNAYVSLKKLGKRNSDSVLFSRFMVSTATEPNSDSYSPLHGSNLLRPNMKLASAWGEVRELSPEQIHELAVEMVKRVRERGPFLNMADFVNRRLEKSGEKALTGALQAAIDATDINSVFMDDDFKIKPNRDGSFYSFADAEEGSMYTAAPGYLIQSDVLMSLGNILTVRDDTFVVRAYGCVRTQGKAVLAQAWCEAVVQRTIDYVDPTNSPEDADNSDNDSSRGANGSTSLSEINRVMGRQFRIVSFRWLDVWDI